MISRRTLFRLAGKAAAVLSAAAVLGKPQKAEALKFRGVPIDWDDPERKRVYFVPADDTFRAFSGYETIDLSTGPRMVVERKR